MKDGKQLGGHEGRGACGVEGTPREGTPVQPGSPRYPPWGLQGSGDPGTREKCWAVPADHPPGRSEMPGHYARLLLTGTPFPDPPAVLCVPGRTPHAPARTPGPLGRYLAGRRTHGWCPPWGGRCPRSGRARGCRARTAARSGGRCGWRGRHSGRSRPRCDTCRRCGRARGSGCTR